MAEMNMPEPVRADKPLISLLNARALETLIQERKNLIVNINGVYEISRPLALELTRAVKEQVAALNGSVREKINCLHACTDFMVFEFMFTIVIEKDGKEHFFDYTEVGEAYAKEKGKEFSMARVAVTRAMKRALERLLGEEFINRVILSLFPAAKAVENEASSKPSKPSDGPATVGQKNYIKSLQKQGKISKEIDADSLTFRQAKKLLDETLNKDNDGKKG